VANYEKLGWGGSWPSLNAKTTNTGSPAPISLPEALPHLKIDAKLGKTFELTKFFQLTFLKGLKAHASFAPASPTAKELFRDSCRHCRFVLRLSLYVGTGFTDSRRKSSRCLPTLPNIFSFFLLVLSKITTFVE